MLYHLSVFLENNPGKLEKITKILADNNLNLRAMSLASSGEFGVMKLLVDNPDKAYDVLKQNKLTVTKRQIVAVVVDNVAGSFNVLLNKLTAKKVNIEDCYGFLLGDGKTAAIVMETETENMEGILKDIGFEALSAEKVYKY